MTLFKKNNDDALYKAGFSDAEKIIIPEWKQKLSDLENEKDEIIASRELEIKNLQIRLENWKITHEKDLENEKRLRKEWSSIKIEWNKINRFKEELQNELSIKLNEDAGKVQSIFQLLGEYTFQQVEK